MDDYDIFYDLGWNNARTNGIVTGSEVRGWNTYQWIGFVDGVNSYYAAHGR